MMPHDDFPLDIACDLDTDVVEEPRQTKTSTRPSPPLHVKHATKKKPRGGYRPVLVDESRLKAESLQLLEPMALINQTCVSDPHFMCQQDIASYYLVVYLNQRYPNHFLESHNPILTDYTSSQLQPSKLLTDLPIHFKNRNLPQKLAKTAKTATTTLFDLVNNYNLHSVPHSARYALANWYLIGSKYHNLVLFVNEIPSSKRVLALQSESKRCVSLIADRLDRLVMNERDPLSFLLHDLVHAHKMFVSDYMLTGQIGFCRAMLKVFDDAECCKLLEDLSRADVAFEDELNYLIADMNSHPKHLFHYFKAVLMNAFKRKFGVAVLGGESWRAFEAMFERVIAAFGLSAEEGEVARKVLVEVNSKTAAVVAAEVDGKRVESFNLVDFTLLDNYFLRLV